MPSLAAAWQLYAFIDNSILVSCSLFLITFFLYTGAALTRVSTCSGHRPRRLGPLSRDVFEASPGLLQVKEGIASNLNCVLFLFLALYHTHRRPASACYVPLSDYGLVTVGPLSTRLLPACRHLFSLSSHPSPFHWMMSPSRGPCR
jgi:hypothetical protein